ncbi:MAG: hypothetical protein FJ098_10740, partial [Deltaproteobacteria bacterium]|nr:hypothetical protein [Deltaproteobacteria bacterium]
MRRIAGILGILAVLAGLPAPADAGWVPGQIAVQGDLENLAGEPIPGPVHLIFALYPSLTAQEPVWWEIHSQVPLVQGSFDLLLGEVSPLDDPPLFEFHSELWVGVTVNGAPELPRVPLVSVGYSFQAAHAATADALSQPAGDLECPGCVGTGDLADGGVGFPDLAATGCVGGEVLKRNTGNTGWECLPDADSDSGGDITAVSAGAGLLGGGDGGALTLSANPAYLQRRVTPGCAAGSAIRSVAEDGSTTCEADNDLLAELSCPDGMIPRRSAGVWGCALPILEAEVDAAVANNGYASQASLAAVATSGSFLDLVDVPPDLADGDDTGLTGSGTAGSFARFGPS